jgi:hypothetical protein
MRRRELASAFWLVGITPISGGLPRRARSASRLSEAQQDCLMVGK